MTGATKTVSVYPRRAASYTVAPVIGNSLDGRPLAERPNPQSQIEVINMAGLITNVAIDPIALQKMQYYVGYCSQEISWLGTVETYGSTALINEVYLFDQEVSPATTEIDASDLSQFANHVIAEAGDRAGTILNGLKFWGHSHVRMGANPSGTDDATMEELFADSGHDFAIRGIANKNGDFRMDVYNYNKGIVIQNCPWVVMKEDDPELADEIVAEMKEKVSKRSYSYAGRTGGAYGAYASTGQDWKSRYPHIYGDAIADDLDDLDQYGYGMDDYDPMKRFEEEE